MRAITVKYFGPTDHKGSRLRASSGKLSTTIGWAHDLDCAGNYNEALRAHVTKLAKDGPGWHGRWIGATLGEQGYVYVQMPTTAHASELLVDIGTISRELGPDAVNVEGLTFEEWRNALGKTADNMSRIRQVDAWTAGVDPTEYRV